jgi:hypothetical protein
LRTPSLTHGRRIGAGHSILTVGVEKVGVGFGISGIEFCS